jgi:hypothetical protein
MEVVPTGWRRCKARQCRELGTSRTWSSTTVETAFLCFSVLLVNLLPSVVYVYSNHFYNSAKRWWDALFSCKARSFYRGPSPILNPTSLRIYMNLAQRRDQQSVMLTRHTTRHIGKKARLTKRNAQNDNAIGNAMFPSPRLNIYSPQKLEGWKAKLPIRIVAQTE